MNKEQIVEAILIMRDEYAHSAGEDLKRIGRKALSSPVTPVIPPLERGYYEAQAKIYALDELLEKIASTPDDTDDIKQKEENQPCPHSSIRSSSLSYLSSSEQETLLSVQL